MKNVLFVCLGNICRSATAEGVMMAYLDANDLCDAVAVDSAGTGPWHVGEPADPRMGRAARQRRYDLASVARQVRADELTDWDLVVAMDRSNEVDLRALDHSGAATIRLFSDFLPEGSPIDVPDPYYGGDQGFDTVLDLIEEGCPVIVEHLIGG